jgi:hypothetical protein
MGQAVTLARWIGTGRRPVTPGRLLRKADVAAAGAVLGVDVPAKLRTMADIRRRVLVPVMATLGDLHVVIQILFGWDGDHLHEFTVEKTLPRDHSQDYPVWVAFQGDSPVEYWSEEKPEEPKPFGLKKVNRRLAALGREPA